MCVQDKALISKVFRMREAALEPGWHGWKTPYPLAGQDWRATGLSCLTTVLQQA